ncbi:MAG: pyridoxal-phosphate-dependent aminotransferase family protein [Planctomycetota bacterium]|jgi:aspartate aminotransferase-like enzyme
MVKPRLFTPGPTDVPPAVLNAMAEPIFHHRTQRFRDMLARVSAGMQQILMTSNDILTIAGSGTAGMEAAIACAVPRDKKVLIADGGKFGARWVKVGKGYGLDVDEVKLEWGTALQPDFVALRLSGGEYGAVVVVHSETSTATACDLQAIAKVAAGSDAILIADCITSAAALPLKTDEWGVDIVATGSQKALMLPPGMAFLSVSDKAWAHIDQITQPGLYLDLKAYRKSLAKWDTPYTAPVSLIRGAEVAVGLINETGIETVWLRTALLAEAFRAACEALGMKVFSKQPSDSVTAVFLPEGVTDKQFRDALHDRFGCSVAGGQNELKDKVFRVSHMGFVDAVDTLGLIGAIECLLAEFGGPVQTGAGTAAAAKVLADWV